MIHLLQNGRPLSSQGRGLLFSQNLLRAFSTTTVDATIDYYSALDISRSATQKKIRLAYFTLAKKHHPDLNAHKSEKDYEKATKRF